MWITLVLVAFYLLAILGLMRWWCNRGRHNKSWYYTSVDADAVKVPVSAVDEPIEVPVKYDKYPTAMTAVKPVCIYCSRPIFQVEDGTYLHWNPTFDLVTSPEFHVANLRTDGSVAGSRGAVDVYAHSGAVRAPLGQVEGGGSSTVI